MPEASSPQTAHPDPPVRSLSGNARGRATRQRLLDAATACFGETGYGAVRVTDVTERAGVSHGAFYRHFTDKKELLFEALRVPLDELLDSMEAAGSEGSATRHDVLTVTRRFFTVYSEHRQVLRVLRELAVGGDPQLANVWLSVRHRYIERIETLIDRSPEPTDSTGVQRNLLAEALGAVLDQLAYTRLGLATRDPSDAQVEDLALAAAHVWAASLNLVS